MELIFKTATSVEGVGAVTRVNVGLYDFCDVENADGIMEFGLKNGINQSIVNFV